ncbi:MAG: hypothetical protein ACKVOU_15300 [Cytophagales bacterium]
MSSTFLEKLLLSIPAKLNATQPKVRKCTNFNDKLDTTTIEKVDWGQELTLFYGINIFKPSLVGIYQTQKSKNDNGIAWKYFKTLKSKTNIDSLFIYQNKLGKTDSIKAFGSNNTIFFRSKLAYLLVFKGKNLHKYGVKSEKIFIWGKKDAFSMLATLQ